MFCCKALRLWVSVIFVMTVPFMLLTARADTADCHLRISLLTCGPGDELYATFGHSAIRIIDSAAQTDIVYNYGTFDFDDPNFYLNFTRGKLNYYLSYSDFNSFLSIYLYEQRKVSEQVLNLDCLQRQQIRQFLLYNALPENKYYKYDFLFDNCSTRIRDIFYKLFDHQLQLSNVIPFRGMTFRQVINQYLEHKEWEGLGINLVLGSRTDAVMKNKDILFLPDYLMKGLGAARINQRPLVTHTQVLFVPEPPAVKNGLRFTPFLLFSLLFLLYAALTFVRLPSIRNWLPWLDRLLFFSTGLLGSILLFLWWGSDHVMCSRNFNLLWALPTHLVFCLFLQKRQNWIKSYALGTAILSILLLCLWNVLPQTLPSALIPLVLLILLRACSIFIRFRAYDLQIPS